MTRSLLSRPLHAAGWALARFLARPRDDCGPVATSGPDLLAATLQPGDVLLVEGNSRFSTAIKYLTQSSWSHAALYVGAAAARGLSGGEPHLLLEADINEGVRTVPLSRYARRHTRICRPVGLASPDIDRVLDFALARLGQRYDLKNIVDLARYLLPTPPVPSRWRRRLLALGSGDPTRAICSSLIAQAFQSIRYPILPNVVLASREDRAGGEALAEILHIRHHSLFAPRDFDVSPYFRIVKPTLESGFDPGALEWALTTGESPIPGAASAPVGG